MDASAHSSDRSSDHGRPLEPLAARLRPQTLSEYRGQEHLLGPGGPLRPVADGSAPLRSSLLVGPPGVGKTTLARLLAQASGADFIEASAISETVAGVRKTIAQAQQRREQEGRQTVYFLDEIHRFSKAQQDVLLAAVEAGTIVLIGATTENPSFSVIRALLSRCAVYRLEPLAEETTAALAREGAAALGFQLDDALVTLLSGASGGDGRSLLTVLENAAGVAAAARGQGSPPTEVELRGAIASRAHGYDRGDDRYDLLSALIKSVRGSDPQAAVYYAAALLEAGEDPRVVARRLVISASEDIGLADNRMLGVAVAAAQAVEIVGMPEARITLSHAAIALARAPKSNSAYQAIAAAGASVSQRGIVPPPPELRDGNSMRATGAHYRNPHTDPGAAGYDHLPEGLRGQRFWRPSGNGADKG